MLTRDGLKAYDGAACRDVPTLSGILSDGRRLHVSKNDADGSVCGKAQTYTSASYAVPKPLPAGSLVVAANAGSAKMWAGHIRRITIQSLHCPRGWELSN